MIGNSRVKKMTSRDGLLQELLASATEDITLVSNGDQYPVLLKALIVQSMIKIEEDAITVICREEDIDAVKSVTEVGDGCGYLCIRVWSDGFPSDLSWGLVLVRKWCSKCHHDSGIGFDPCI